VVDGVRRIGSTDETLMLVGGRRRVQLQQDYEQKSLAACERLAVYVDIISVMQHMGW
jgi:hypothetical protein